MHDDPKRWRLADDRVELQNVARGQEFVLGNVAAYPDVGPWLRDLVKLAG